ncbi:MAG: UDP-3-O-(3-hydroxymyristoyl)glucosamine N-acyltransferase [Ignavibacteria bacterium]|nr:UDP-3-O-(3-hydroxymyristoyl)glucosamine N-acyltransferase [Ignavibacteria bacterium]
MKISEIVKIVDGILCGNSDLEINAVGKIETASEGDITFISNPAYEKYFETTKAGAVLVSENFVPRTEREDITVIKVRDPYRSFLDLIEIFNKEEEDFSGISDFCSIGDDPEIADDVHIGNYTSIGKIVKIGSKSKIYPNCSIGNNVEIGNNCIIYPNVSIYNGCKIGNNVIIHSGTVIGSDGFGFAKQEDGTYKKIPQRGIVLIEDDVEIGSNCTIDRATIGETKICKGVKLDNQIMVAHNVEIGENTVIAAQTGIAGSTKIGKRCMIGGKAGIGGHLRICDDVTLGAAIGLVKSITKPGMYMGYRAKPMREFLHEEANIKRIPRIEEEIKEIKNKLK